MKLGVLFSGGKDSTLALHLAAEKEQVACLITLVSRNPESYMFHTPNIEVTVLQAEALGLPMVSVETEGKKEEELADLERAIAEAKSKIWYRRRRDWSGGICVSGVAGSTHLQQFRPLVL